MKHKNVYLEFTQKNDKQENLLNIKSNVLGKP